MTLQPRAYKEVLPQVSAPDDHQHVRFTISKLQCTDFGLYTVEVKNIMGVAKCFVNLKVRFVVTSFSQYLKIDQVCRYSK